MLLKFRIAVFIIISLIFSAQYSFAQSQENNPSNIEVNKEQLIKKNAQTKHEIDSLKIVLKNLDANLKKHLKVLYTLKYGKKKGIRISIGSIWKGMTEDMLNDSWGKPDRTNKIKKKWGIFTQWYYGDITYFFKNSKLIEWEQKKKDKKG
ncbi:MAG: hypothetical protein IIA48_03675 [Bacteroidetes bacterium]|nr:hypothetical protein [Bacteroidota bacterium]